MSLDIRDLRLVQSVAACGSLAGAAPRLHLTPSALSHQLRGLERDLQAQLFLRVGKRMVPTEPGRRLLASAERVLRELGRAEEDLVRLAAGRAGTLRLSTACYTSYHWLPRLLREFQGRHPGLTVQVLPEFTRRPLDALREGELDVAIVFSPIVAPDLVAEPFLRDELLVLASSAHPAAERACFRPEDFAGQELFLYSDDPQESLFLAEVLVPAGVVPGAVHAIPLTEAIVELVRAGGGLSVLASWAIAPYLVDRSLVAVPLGKRGFRRAWSAVTLKNGPAGAHLPKLVEALRKAARDIGPRPQPRGKGRARRGRAGLS